MQIVEMRITPIALGDPPLLNAAGVHAPYCLRTIVELETDRGYSGLAEVPGGAAVDLALADARTAVIGCDPLNWERLRTQLEAICPPDEPNARGDRPWDKRIRIQVYSALDVACLDISGKAFGVPVANLLGGVVRDRVPFAAYLFYKYEGAGGSLGYAIDPQASGWAAARQAAALDPDSIVAQAEAMIEEFGFKSVKLKGGVFAPEAEVAAMVALRGALGPDVPLRHDPNATWTIETALKWSKQLEPILEYWEDPVRGQESMAEVRRAVRVPLATNMCTTSFADLPGSVRLGSEDVILTDHHYWGGLRASMALAAHCRIFGRGVSMHSNNHAGISLAAMIHLGAAMPNLSYALDTHYPWQDADVIAGGRIKIEEGSVALPSGPGLGVELDRIALDRAHQAFLRCNLSERNDQAEMQKMVPGWTFQATRW
jgi:glucarate dehydratase